MLCAVAAPANAQPSAFDGGPPRDGGPLRDGGASVAPPAGPRAEEPGGAEARPKNEASGERDGGAAHERDAPNTEGASDGEAAPGEGALDGDSQRSPGSAGRAASDADEDAPLAMDDAAPDAGGAASDAPSNEARRSGSPTKPSDAATRATAGEETNAREAMRAAPARDGGTPVDVDAFVGPPMSAIPPPPTMGPKLARPAGPARSRPKRDKVAEEPVPVESDPPDAGVRDGGAREAFVGPPPREPPAEPQEEGLRDLIARIVKAQWSFLRVLLFAFIVFRIAALVVRRMARANHQLALVLSRLWVFVEATGWAAIGVWLFTRLSQTESTVTAGLAGLVVLALITLSWGAIKDVIAGLMISAERPFTVGDHVSVGDAAGQVRNFRTRVLELETDNGHVVRVPYRHVSGATDVRRGGRRTAHAVSLTLELPDTLDAVEALDLARELASSSPWSVLGVAPKLRLDEGHATAKIVMEAYAFDREAGPLLHADLLSGWREAQRKG